MPIVTADLVDRYPDLVAGCDVQFRQFGGIASFAGPIRTVQTLEDNARMRTVLEAPGGGAVLVVDGGGSLRTALMGDQIADLAARNGWAGVILFGAVRDSVQLRTLPLGIKALGTNPIKSGKVGTGTVDLPVCFGGVIFTPRAWLYSDEDGILVASQRLPDLWAI